MTEPPALRTGGAEVNGAVIAYDEAGQGPPLVLLHAGIADRRMWDDHMAALAARHRVVRPDLRGFGDTMAPAGAFAHHADVAGLMAALSLPRAVVVGASMGGAVAVDLAIARPDLVAALVLVGSALDGHVFQDPDTRAGWQAADDALARGALEEAADIEIDMWVAGPGRGPGDVDPGVRERLRAMLLPAYTDDVEREEEALDPPAAARLDEIRCPALVLIGEHDRPDIVRAADVLGRGIAGARTIPLAGVAHLPPMERPEEFTSILLDFTASLQL